MNEKFELTEEEKKKIKKLNKSLQPEEPEYQPSEVQTGVDNLEKDANIEQEKKVQKNLEERFDQEYEPEAIEHRVKQIQQKREQNKEITRSDSQENVELSENSKSESNEEINLEHVDDDVKEELQQINEVVDEEQDALSETEQEVDSQNTSQNENINGGENEVQQLEGEELSDPEVDIDNKVIENLQPDSSPTTNMSDPKNIQPVNPNTQIPASSSPEEESRDLQVVQEQISELSEQDQQTPIQQDGIGEGVEITELGESSNISPSEGNLQMQNAAQMSVPQGLQNAEANQAQQDEVQTSNTQVQKESTSLEQSPPLEQVTHNQNVDLSYPNQQPEDTATAEVDDGNSVDNSIQTSQQNLDQNATTPAPNNIVGADGELSDESVGYLNNVDNNVNSNQTLEEKAKVSEPVELTKPQVEQNVQSTNFEPAPAEVQDTFAANDKPKKLIEATSQNENTTQQLEQTTQTENLQEQTVQQKVETPTPPPLETKIAGTINNQSTKEQIKEETQEQEKKKRGLGEFFKRKEKSESEEKLEKENKEEKVPKAETNTAVTVENKKPKRFNKNKKSEESVDVKQNTQTNKSEDQKEKPPFNWSASFYALILLLIPIAVLTAFIFACYFIDRDTLMCLDFRTRLESLFSLFF